MDDDAPGGDPVPDKTTWDISPDLEGRLLGDFRIVRKLGEGGMGIVFEAEQQHPKRPVALKVIRGGAFVDENQIKMFQREAQTLARLKHPAIAAIYEMGRTHQGQHFFAMELVRGETLGAWLKQGSPDLKLKLGLFRKICDAVAYAHQRGVIHRDLKPSNILVMKESSSASTASGLGIPDVKILDFGLARITDADMAASTFITDMGTVRGTLPYMSPEQIRGNPDEIDLRTDVYSLGVLLYEMLTGKLPHDLGKSGFAEAARIICDEPPAPLTKTWGGTKRLDADVATIANKALEKEPARRYQSAAALAEDVGRYLADLPIQARPPSAVYQFRKLVARHTVGFGFIGALFVMAIALAVTMTLEARRIAIERDRANREAAAASSVVDFLVGLFQVVTPSKTRGATLTVRDILDKGAADLGSRMAEQPAIQGRLFGVMGDVYLNLGMYPESEALLRKAVDAQTKAFGADSVENAEALRDLGLLNLNYGRNKEALDLEQRALAILERRLPKDDVRVAKVLYRLSNAQTSLGNLDVTQASIDRALPIFRETLGPESVWVAWCINDYGGLAMSRGELETALAHFREALRIKQLALPPGDPDITAGKENIGYVLLKLGRYDEAERLLLAALADIERIYGPTHPSTANALDNLAECQWRQGRLDESLRNASRALAILEATTDPDNVNISTVLYDIARIERDLGHVKDADRDFRRCLTLREKVLGPTAPEVATTLDAYALLLRASGRDAEAAATEARARAIPHPPGPDSGVVFTPTQ
jgi:tetratricopeptide (TPR) repeat protein